MRGRDRRIAATLLSCAAAAAVAVVALPSAARAGTAAPVGASPDADTYVTAAFPTANNGSSTTLRVGATPTRVSYLRFTVQGLAVPFAGATLQLYATAGGGDLSVSPVADSTWTNAMAYPGPTPGAVVATHGAFAASTWQSADVSSVVTGNGTYSFAVTSASSGVFASSRAGTATAPQLLVTPGTTPTPTPAPTVTPSPTPTPKPGPPHVMVIVMENQEYGAVIGSGAAPYINSLATSYAAATSWFAVQHNSPTDYLALISGSTQNLPATPPPYSTLTVVDELAGEGIGWRAYMEDMPSACFRGGGSGGYVKYHNPFMYFSSIVNTPSQCNSIVPFATNFASDLGAGTAPPFLFVVPSLCNDMHDSCLPLGNPVAQGDQWLRTQLPTVLQSSWYRSGGVVVITWDEGTTRAGINQGSGGHVPTVVISADAHLAYTQAGDHYGTLRAIEEVYGVGLLGASADLANGDLRAAF
ncbi:MAG TPA: alkaline phosphatase family protein [Candidatus Dormibacteraeota bacterium]